jgi:hypothetical protein
MKARLLVRSALASLALVAASGGLASIASTASASSSSHSMTVKLAFWFKHFGLHDFNTLDNDYALAESEVGGKLDKLCVQMATDVTAAQANPIPDAQIQVHWATALKAAENGDIDCIYGFGTGKAKSVRAAGPELAKFESQSTIAFTMLGKYL